MTDAQTTSALAQKRPRSGPGTWPRHYCDPEVSPKHAKGAPSPRTSPVRAPQTRQLEPDVVAAVAVALGGHPRHQEPPDVVADVLLRLLPMPDAARATVAMVHHRLGTGSCDNMTYRQAGALGTCVRRTAILRMARTESYGAIRVEPRAYPYGGSAPNLVTTQIPAWVYDQVDAARLRLPPVDGISAAVAPPAPLSVTAAGGGAAPGESGAAPASAPPPPPPVEPTPREPSPEPPLRAPAPVLSPADAALEARLAEIHAFTGQRFEPAAVRGLNAQRAEVRGGGGGVPGLDDAQLLGALAEYARKQRPVFERKRQYRERLPDRAWVERGIHVFLWQKRAHLDGLASEPARGARKGSARATAPQRAGAAVASAAVVAPVRLGVELEPATTIVRSVQAGSLAASLLLEPGDKLLRIDGQALETPADLRAVLSSLPPGPHTFELVRWNEVVTATVTLEARGPPTP